MTDLRALLARTADHVAAYREAASEAAVLPEVDLDAVRVAIGGRLPDGPTPAGEVVGQLVAAVEPAMVATTGPRYFGFVIGGALDAATAADVLAVGWDQPANNHLSSPASALVEEVAGAWLVELLGLPSDVSFGFVTGAQGANTVCLAAARHKVLADAGWDVERNGLAGGPAVTVVASEERHATIDRSLRLLGLGAGSLQPVPADGNGAIDVAALGNMLASKPAGPTIVCLQSGNVNTGACDDLAGAVAAAHEHGAWAHVDGAFGLWAAASPATRPLVAGIETADSWGTDGHKWLNVPYDSGYAFCAHRDAHAAAMAYTAAYLVGTTPAAVRPPSDYVLESSRRARGFATWAALRELGRGGIAELVDRCCALARRFATQLAAIDGISVVNDVVLNQVLVRFGDDATTRRRSGSSRLCNARASAGWARRRGTASGLCASRCQAGVPPRLTSTGRYARSSPRRAPDPGSGGRNRPGTYLGTILTSTRSVKRVQATLRASGPGGGPGTTVRAACLAHRVLRMARRLPRRRHEVAARPLLGASRKVAEQLSDCTRAGKQRPAGWSPFAGIARIRSLGWPFSL